MYTLAVDIYPDIKKACTTTVQALKYLARAKFYKLPFLACFLRSSLA